jgi:hypothetical protein
VFGYSFDTTGPRVRDRDVVDDRPATTERRGLFGRRRTVATNDGTSDGRYDRDSDAPLTADRRADAPPDDREPVASATTTRSTRTTDDT